MEVFLPASDAVRMDIYTEGAVLDYVFSLYCLFSLICLYREYSGKGHK